MDVIQLTQKVCLAELLMCMIWSIVKLGSLLTRDLVLKFIFFMF